MPRRRGNPVLVLVCFALVVAVVLALGWRWADSKAAPPDITSPPAVTDPDAPAGTGDAELTTPVLSLRRAPGILSRNLNHEAFQQALQPLLDGVSDTSCIAVSVDGVAVAAKNEAVPLIPASNMKLIVAAVALDVLGEDHRFTTTVLGEVDAAGVVNGNLYLVGGGDPVLSTDWWVASDVMTFPVINATRVEDLAAAVVATGVRQVTGSIVGDATRYDDEFFAPSWDEEVRANLEGGPYDALLVSDARTSLSEVAEVPAVGAAKVLTELLGASGVTVAGEPVAGRAAATTELARIESQPLPAILDEMLKTSDNNTAELLVKEIGFAERSDGSREAGLAVIRQRLEEWGVLMDGVELADGSGLSNNNRLTCGTLLGVIQHGAVDDPVGQGLAVAGMSGTLAENFKGTEVEGRLRGKTGTLNNVANTTPTANPPGVRSLSGYVPIDGGGAVEFALILTGQTITNKTEYEPIWYDLLAPALGSYPSAASVTELLPL
jgi:D-alanyl-D-alanine carboxypeptidase/D-alanyl-D-alanine-endopeptidase (penicillin-binding protein 4)